MIRWCIIKRMETLKLISISASSCFHRINQNYVPFQSLEYHPVPPSSVPLVLTKISICLSQWGTLFIIKEKKKSVFSKKTFNKFVKHWSLVDWTSLAYLESDELLLPWVDTRQVNLFECLMAHTQVNPIWSYCKLKSYCLMSFRHFQRVLSKHKV